MSARPTPAVPARQQCGVCGSFLDDDATPGKHECPKCGSAYEVPEPPLSAKDIADMRALYGPVAVPPCRICGGSLSIQAAGGGEATKWACNILNKRRDEGVRPDAADWKHFSDSYWTDYRCGGDSRVIAALDLLASAPDMAARIAALEAENAVLREVCRDSEETMRAARADLKTRLSLPDYEAVREFVLASLRNSIAAARRALDTKGVKP